MKSLPNPKNVPVKWLVMLFVAVILYGLLQPRLNKHFGWNLPSIADLPEPPQKQANPDRKQSEPKQEDEPKFSGEDSYSENRKPPIAPELEHAPRPSDSSTATASTKEPPKPGNTAGSLPSDDPLDYLQTVGNQTYRSPSGLIYRRGSAEGHRLKHLERHLENDPNRPGSHGVFEGSMVEFLIKIDETFDRANKKERGTKAYDEEGRTIYEASFAKELGYLGGQEGKRRKNPKLKRIRLVVDGEAVITAFPF